MKNKKKGTLLMTGGLLLIAAALLLTGYNIWDERRAAASAEVVLEELHHVIQPVKTTSAPVAETAQEVEIPDYILNPNMDMPTVEIDGEDYIGTIAIPALGLDLPIRSEWSYPGLKTAPCRYGGSAYLGNLIIAAHNYRTHFGNLKELPMGEQIVFTDTAGNVFRYTAAALETLDGKAVEEMQSGDWDLTLFTCTYGGKSRLTVRCVRSETE